LAWLQQNSMTEQHSIDLDNKKTIIFDIGKIWKDFTMNVKDILLYIYRTNTKIKS
jgi:hypothetical protein